jgi:DTW domain-containing protein YfiP
MDKSEYLLKKQIEQQKITPHRDICCTCLRPATACLCNTIQPFNTNFEFCILMHPLEAKRMQVGTGRMLNKALLNCQLIVGESFDKDAQVQRILKNPKYYPILLYPGPTSVNISEVSFDKSLIEDKTPIIFILDSTWACSKKMLKLTTSIHNIPRISFTLPFLSKFDIKTQPKDYCLSTIESVYCVLTELEKQGFEDLGVKKEELPNALRRLVVYQLACANDPNKRHYSHRTSKVKSNE